MLLIPNLSHKFFTENDTHRFDPNGTFMGKRVSIITVSGYLFPDLNVRGLDQIRE